MPILEIDGVGRVDVGPEFFKLAPDQQEATVNEIVSSLKPERGTVSVKPYQPSATDTAFDVAKSAGVGLGKGVIGVAGMAGDVRSLAGRGIDYAANAAGISPDVVSRAKDYATQASKLNPITAMLTQAPTSAQVRAPIEEQTGKFYESQTPAGRYTGAAMEMVPGALMGPGGPVRNAIAFGAIPGLASEFAGEQTKGTPLEPYARGGAALVSGGIAGIATAPKNTAGLVARSAGGATPDQLQAAEQLFQMAQQNGQPITRAEAVQFVTNSGTRLGNMQRVVEGEGGLREFYSQRAGQNVAARDDALNSIAPPAQNFYGETTATLGRPVVEAADRAIEGVRQDINRFARPHYAQGEATPLLQQDWANIQNIPGWQEARDAVRNNAQLNRYVSHLPDNSVGFVDAVKQQVEQSARAANSPMNANRNPKIAGGLTNDAATLRQAVVDGSRQVPGSPYEAAMNIEAETRRRLLQPLKNGPLGKLAKSDGDVARAIDILFSPNASADEIAVATRLVSNVNPYAARDLTRAYLRMKFDEATQVVSRTDMSTAGASFWKEVAGNPQQRENLQAVITSLPNGGAIWPGVDRFLTILEAQSLRRPIGSETAFNKTTQEALRQGNAVQETTQAVSSGLMKLPSKISGRIEEWRMGRNVDDLARLLTDPTAGREFARMANSNSAGATTGSVIRLIGLAGRPSQSGQNPR
jgi:hypothetical protein